jgi:hypothetical protein
MKDENLALLVSLSSNLLILQPIYSPNGHLYLYTSGRVVPLRHIPIAVIQTAAALIGVTLDAQVQPWYSYLPQTVASMPSSHSIIIATPAQSDAASRERMQ